jgi:hypothetical protein
MQFEMIKGGMPFYKEGEGNGCMIFVGDKLEWVPRGERSCLHHFAKHYFVDLHELRKRTMEILGRKKYIPLVFHDECTLIPFKARHPIFKDDGAYGYIVMESIVDIRIKNGKVMILLDSGLEIASMTSVKKLREYIATAKMLKVAILHLH